MGDILLITLVLFPLCAAPCLYGLGRRNGRLRDLLLPAVAGAELLCALALLAVPGAVGSLPRVCALGLQFTASGFRVLMAITAAGLWLGTALASRQYFAHAERVDRYYFFYLLTLGALMGVFLSADLFTTFVFFEIMSFTSYIWVVQNETPAARRAADTYLAVAVVGGLTLLMGLVLLYDIFDTLEIGALAGLATTLPSERQGRLYAAGACCLVGFGAKAGMFPLHIWLPKAHPVAPAPASALLSGILTKSGVFGVLCVSCNLFFGDLLWGNLILTLGVVTMSAGAVLAVFSVDLKRTLACSSMSQIGFILVGIGMAGLLGAEHGVAVWGTILHMLNHSLIKLVLFLCAGVVYLGAHALDLNHIRGYGRDKPLLKAVFLVGALSIAGVPGFSGYVSKTLLHEGIVEYIHLLAHEGLPTGAYQAAEVLFLLSGGLTAAYMTKLFVAVFVEPPPATAHQSARPYLDRATGAALWGGSAVLLILGLTPHLTMEPVAAFAAEFMGGGGPAETVSYFALANLKGAVISLSVGAAVYLLAVRGWLSKKAPEGGRVYLDRWPQWLDLEERVYRPLLGGLAFVGAALARVLASLGDGVFKLGRRVLFLKAPGVIEPKSDSEFGVYGNDPEDHIVTGTFAFDLMVAGIGLVIVLGYLLLR